MWGSQYARSFLVANLDGGRGTRFRGNPQGEGTEDGSVLVMVRHQRCRECRLIAKNTGRKVLVVDGFFVTGPCQHAQGATHDNYEFLTNCPQYKECICDSWGNIVGVVPIYVIRTIKPGRYERRRTYSLSCGQTLRSMSPLGGERR